MRTLTFVFSKRFAFLAISSLILSSQAFANPFNATDAQSQIAHETKCISGNLNHDDETVTASYKQDNGQILEIKYSCEKFRTVWQYSSYYDQAGHSPRACCYRPTEIYRRMISIDNSPNEHADQSEGVQ